VEAAAKEPKFPRKIPRMAQLKVPYIGLEEVTDKPRAVGKALAAEFLGTALLVFVGCGSTIGGD
jgi:hypothetical protein